jgi:hypothetical protein
MHGALDSALYAAHIACSYALMLAVMTYNGGVLLTVVASMTAGRVLVAQLRRGGGARGGAGGAGRVAEQGTAAETERLLGVSTADACCAPSLPAAI